MPSQEKGCDTEKVPVKTGRSGEERKREEFCPLLLSLLSRAYVIKSEPESQRSFKRILKNILCLPRHRRTNLQGPLENHHIQHGTTLAIDKKCQSGTARSEQGKGHLSSSQNQGWSTRDSSVSPGPREGHKW